MATENHPQIVIEKGITIPPGQGFRKDSLEEAIRRAFLTMEVGDSFVWPRESRNFYRAARQVKAKITCRKLPAGWRIWLKAKPKSN